jgi:Leucine-rich repeat (LRR) protein
LNDNNLKGRLPREVALLTNLQTLNTASNQLTGSVPNVSNLINLKSLHLYENAFTGTIPESVQQLERLEVLFLSSNKFTGTIPKTISRVSRTLKGMYLSDNNLSGSIPTQMCEFSSLGTHMCLFLFACWVVVFHRPCGLTLLLIPILQCLPSLFSFLSFFGKYQNTEALFVDTNTLNGQIPNCFGRLTNLRQLFLFQNQLTGTVPNDLQSLSHLSK